MGNEKLKWMFMNKLSERAIKRSIIVLSISLILIACSARAFSLERGTSSEIEKLIEEALLKNPELKASEERIQAYEQKPDQARSFDDPRLTLSFMNLPVDTFRFDQEAMTQKQVSLMQKFPYPGKLDLKGDMAMKDLAVVIKEGEQKKNRVIAQVKTAYHNLLFLKKAIILNEESRGLLAGFLQTAETEYAVGRGLQQSILKAQMELSKIIQRGIALRQQQETATARLNFLLNRPVDSHLGITGDLEQSIISLTYQELCALAEESHPALSGLEEKIERASLARKLAEREYYPDMDVGLSYGQRDDSSTAERPDFFSASVTLNIPLWQKTKESRKVSEESANERHALEQYQAFKNNILFRLKELLAEIEMYRQEIELFKTGLIPQSTSSFEASMSGYRVNTVDVLTVINNQLTLYNYKIEYYRAIADHENSVAALEETVGRKIF
ncbi:MAG: TolC family protein [Nitrospiraceae bacterium]|nr:MAG: TolC family protein [Nitrospiraceae bacterium]